MSKPVPHLSDDSEPAKPAQAIWTAIDALLETVSPSEREFIRRKINEKLRPISVPQAGDVLGIVVQLIPRDRPWTVAELKETLERHGSAIEAKEIHNAIGYLKRRNHIQRLGYGRYIIGGVPFVTADDLGGERSITCNTGGRFRRFGRSVRTASPTARSPLRPSRS